MNPKWTILIAIIISCHSPSTPGTTAESSVTNSAVDSSALGKQIDSPMIGASTRVQNPAVRANPNAHVIHEPGPSQVFIADLNNDLLSDTIRIRSSQWDTASFDTIQISIAKFGSRTFYTDTLHPWVAVDQEFLVSNKNELPTQRLFLGKNARHAVILLFGELTPAGYRQNFSIINIEDNRAKLVLNQTDDNSYIESPIRLRDFDGDGRLDFLYRQIFEFNGGPDTLGGKIGTYSPYFIYSVDSNCVLNRVLTAGYNKEHYVFAGFKYDESIQVFYPNDGSKPRLWKQ